jgi:hypothetical protein
MFRRRSNTARSTARSGVDALWTTFWHFLHTRIKDIEVESSFTRAIKFCQAELQRAKLRFAFVQVLEQWSTDNPAKLKLARSMFKSGHQAKG